MLAWLPLHRGFGDAIRLFPRDYVFIVDNDGATKECMVVVLVVSDPFQGIRA